MNYRDWTLWRRACRRNRNQESNSGSVKGHLTAWDPVQQKEVWRSIGRGPGMAERFPLPATWSSKARLGQFEAFRADTGEKIWSHRTQTGGITGPVTYTVNGEQYVAVLAGWGGVLPLAAGEVALQNARMNNVPRMLAFKLGGKASLPPAPEVKAAVLNASAGNREPRHRQEGRRAVSTLLWRLSWRRCRQWRGSARPALFRRFGQRAMVRAL